MVGVWFAAWCAIRASTYLDDTYRACPTRCSHFCRWRSLRVVQRRLRDLALGKGFRKTELDTDLLRIAFHAPLPHGSSLQGASWSAWCNRGAGRRRWMVIALLWMNRCNMLPLRPLVGTIDLVGWDADLAVYA